MMTLGSGFRMPEFGCQMLPVRVRQSHIMPVWILPESHSATPDSATVTLPLQDICHCHYPHYHYIYIVDCGYTQATTYICLYVLTVGTHYATIYILLLYVCRSAPNSGSLFGMSHIHYPIHYTYILFIYVL